LGEHSKFFIWTSFVLALAGGLLMVASGFAAHGFMLSILNDVAAAIPSYLGGIAGITADLAILIVAVLISLGGVTVVVGAFMILRRHITLGRILLALGGGTGFIGLFISFGYAALTKGLTSALGQAPYWLGLVLVIVAGRAARASRKGPSPVQSEGT
jgi:hypothetical protein